MTKQPFDINSPEFQRFYDTYLKPSLLKVDYANNYAYAKFKRKLLFSLNVLGLLILLYLLCHTIFSTYFFAAQEWYNEMIENYTIWFKSQSLLKRVFLPNQPFYFGFPAPHKFIIISLCILPIICLRPFFKARQNKPNIFQLFFQFFDPQPQILNHQKLKYALNLEEILSLPSHQVLSLQDNVEVNIDNQLVDIAQIKLLRSSTTSPYLKWLLPKFETVYKGLILSTILPSKAERFIKIFLGNINHINFDSFESLYTPPYLDKNIEKKIKIFASKQEDIIALEEVQQIMQYMETIQQYNYRTPITFDKLISDKITDNLTDANIPSYNYIEITIFESNLVILITTNHALFEFNSPFQKIEPTNDSNLLLASINLLLSLRK
jgi:hypothetical protein